jgi:hypothetical protein
MTWEAEKLPPLSGASAVFFFLFVWLRTAERHTVAGKMAEVGGGVTRGM